MKNKRLKTFGIWFLALALFLVHAVYRNTAHAAESSSARQTYSKSGECSIHFPSKPQLVQQSIKLSEQGHRLNYDVYLAPFEDKGVFLLLIATYPLPLTGGHEMAGLEGLLKGIVGHHQDNRLIYAKKIEVEGQTAINFLVENSGSYFRGIALMAGNKLFLVAMEGRKGTMDEEVFGAFLESFKLAGSP